MANIQDHIQRVHAVTRILHETAYYPAHPPRQETPGYQAVHHRLVVEEDRPCFICGIRHSQGGQMETHHWVLEWALAQAADPLRMRTDVPDLPQDEEGFLDWVDHSQENLRVLCADHHRHALVGIHMITYPIWIAQKYVRDDFPLTGGEGNG